MLDIDDEFVDHLKEMMPTILDPVNLVVKRINGTLITGKKLSHYVEVCLYCLRVYCCCCLLVVL